MDFSSYGVQTSFERSVGVPIRCLPGLWTGNLPLSHWNWCGVRHRLRDAWVGPRPSASTGV